MRAPTEALPPPDARVVFIDESGDSESNLVISALSFSEALHEHIRDETDRYIDNLVAFFKLPKDFELHGVRLVRTGKRPEDPDYLKPHARDFIFLNTLDFIAGLPSARIHSVRWDWSPAPRKIHGQSQDTRERRMYLELYKWLDEFDEPMAMTADGTNNSQPGRALELHLKENPASLLSPRISLVDSKAERLVQLADLAAYASAQATHALVNDRTERFRGWHNLTMSKIAATGHWRHAMRCFRGETKPVRTN